ncbi:hypothetical protein JCM5350_004737 [Sporobolomyces pararoseus]
MDNLKSALRFPHPPPPLPPPPIPQHNLSSRFSTETLVVRSPPHAKSIQRFFSSNSSAHSPPRSPATRRSFSSSSPPKTNSIRPKHSPSASESYISIPSPRLYDPEVAPWTRISLDEAEVLRSPTVTKGRGEWAREISGAGSGGAIGASKDKLAGAAKEVMELLARKRQGIGHGRKGSAENSSISPRPKSPRKDSVPSSSADRTNQSLNDRENGFEKGAGRGNDQSSSRKLVDLPPRSDSRNAITTTIASSTPHQASSLPVSSTPQQTKPLKSTLRPNSPPSISIPPLHPQPRLPANPLPSKDDHYHSLPSFEGLVLSKPTREEVENRKSNEILVEIDVGGSLHTTTVENLVRDGRGGKLGSLVETTIRTIKSEGKGLNLAKEEKGGYLQLPNLQLDADDDGHNSGSSLNVTLSHFVVSPNPSPFPFMHNLDEANGVNEEGGNDCCSPIDPLAPQLFLSMPSFAPPPPPLRLDLDPLPTSHQVNVVASPAFNSKHLSVYPLISTNSPPPPSPISPSPPTPTPRRMSVLPSPRSFSYHDLPPSPNELAARRALAKRLHLSTGSFGFTCRQEAGGETFGSDLEPFFQVLRSQAYRTTSPESPSDLFNSQGGEGADLPTDVQESSTTEDSSQQGRIVFGSCLKRLHSVKTKSIDSFPQEEESQSSSTSSRNRRPPSLTRSESTALTESSEYPPSEFLTSATSVTPVPRLRIFLDRSDVTLPSGLGTIYSTLLAFLRERALPPFLTLPSPEDPTLQIDPTTLSILLVQPALAFGQLAALRTIANEAKWLEIDELIKACDVEQQRWVGALRIVDVERVRQKGFMQGRGVVDIRKKRELEGWI